MKLISIKPSTAKEKRFTAIFEINGKTKITNFGFKGGSTFIDHKDEAKKKAYLARHRVNERWQEPTSAGSLARYILWNKTTLGASISDFKRRFNL